MGIVMLGVVPLTLNKLYRPPPNFFGGAKPFPRALKSQYRIRVLIILLNTLIPGRLPKVIT
jgi:hypothetical protein